MKLLERNSMKSRNLVLNRIGASSLVLGVVFVGLGAPPAFASITSPSPVDTSNAIRWDPDNSPIGDIVFEFIDSNGQKKIEAPFPINFYGNRFPAICMATQGLIYPIEQVSSNCRGLREQSVEMLSLDQRSEAIAALALDLDLALEIHNPQRESTEELEVASVTVLDSTITFTTKAPHGFRVGEFAEFSQNADYILNGGSTTSITSSRILTVPTPTTFSITNSGSISNGTSAPIPGNRAVVFRKVIFERVMELQLSGTSLTVRTQEDSDFGVGGKFTFAGTGISGLDGAKFVIASRVDARNFTVTVPATLLDVDSSQVGNQTSMDFFSNPRPWALERDEVGAIQQVYFGTTTVEGRDAYSLTWYRTGNDDFNINGVNGGIFPAINPQTLSFSVQLLIIKRSTGSDAAGWDFDYELNIGHATDASDGYRSDSPQSACNFSDQSKCRWTSGTANLVPGPTISSVSRDGTAFTINTSAPHNLIVGQKFSYDVVTSSRNISPNINTVQSVVDSDTFTFANPNAAFSEETAQSGQIFYSVASELFASSSVLQLIDAGGSTALVRNSLNSNVLGRYTFGMVNGSLSGFLVPTMGQGVSGTPPAAPAATTPPAAPAAPAASTSPVKVLAETGIDADEILSATIWVTILGGLMTLFSRIRFQKD